MEDQYIKKLVFNLGCGGVRVNRGNNMVLSGFNNEIKGVNNYYVMLLISKNYAMMLMLQNYGIITRVDLQISWLIGCI